MSENSGCFNNTSEASKDIDNKISEKKVFNFFKDDKPVMGNFVSEKTEKNMIKYIKGKVGTISKK